MCWFLPGPSPPTHLGWLWGWEGISWELSLPRGQATVSVCWVKEKQFCRCQRGSPCLPVTVPGLEERVHPAWGILSVLDQQPQSLQRGWAKPSVSSPSAQTLFGALLGGQFFCMFWERFIDLGLLCQPLGFGLILGVVWGPEGGQPHGGQDNEQMGLFCCALTGRLVVSFAFFPFSPSTSRSPFLWFPLLRTVPGLKARVPDLAEQRCLSGGQNRPQEGGGACPGEEAALKLLGDRRSAYVLPPGQELEKHPAPPPRAKGTPAGPVTTSHPLPTPDATGTRKDGGPQAGSRSGLPRVQCPREERRE